MRRQRQNPVATSKEGMPIDPEPPAEETAPAAPPEPAVPAPPKYPGQGVAPFLQVVAVLTVLGGIAGAIAFWATAKADVCSFDSFLNQVTCDSVTRASFVVAGFVVLGESIIGAAVLAAIAATIENLIALRKGLLPPPTA